MPRLCFAATLGLLIATWAIPENSHAQSQDSDVENRLLRLEEQMVDLSAQVGTIETIAKGGGIDASSGASAPSVDGGLGGASADDRIVLMETQLRALSSQISDLVQRLNQLEGGGGQNFNNGGFSDPSATPGGFGTTIEGDGSSGSTNQGLNNDFGSGGAQDSALGIENGAPIQTALNSSPQAQSLYDTAYNALVQRNYRAASGSFRQFVDEFPTDPLAGQAYFWLGEAAFVSGQYREAADSFLKSSTNYPDNQKAPESLLKLGISLKRLGETQAACSSFSELGRRFPNDAATLERAERERQRTQC